MNRSRLQSAFTLLELMVVLIIVGIITTIVVMRVGDFGQSRQQRLFAEQVVNVVRAARAEAILQSMTLSLRVQNNKIVFYRHVCDVKTAQMVWVEAVGQQQFSVGKTPSALQIRLPKKAQKITQIVFLPSGEVTQSNLLIYKNQHMFRKIVIARNGQVTLEQ